MDSLKEGRRLSPAASEHMIKGFWKRIKEGLDIVLIGVTIIILWTLVVAIVSTFFS